LVLLSGACGNTDLIQASLRDQPIGQAPPQKQLNQPIQHVYIIVMENHTYDNYFMTYPDPTGNPAPTSGRASGGRMVPIVEPTLNDWSPGDNGWGDAHHDYDQGQMDGFDQPSHQPGNNGDRYYHADGPDGAYVSYAVTPGGGRVNVRYYWFL